MKLEGGDDKSPKCLKQSRVIETEVILCYIRQGGASIGTYGTTKGKRPK